jgi:hypothetical protein
MDYNKHFIYEEGKLLAKYDRDNHLVKAGYRVGHFCATGGGYRRVHFLGRKSPEHRIIWELHNGSIPEGFIIDHIDGNKCNNLIKNLRLVTPSQNNMNRKTPSNNKSGVTGVGFRSREQKWTARININGKRKQLGMFDTLEGATQARRKAEVKYYGEYAPTR